MNEKDKAIVQALASIQNRLRHVYNQGFEDGRKAKRKTGKWVKDEYGTDHCSCCDYIPAYDTAIDDIYYSPYCPHCGAKMEGYGEQVD